MPILPGKSYSNGIVSLPTAPEQPQEGASLMDSLMASGEEALLSSPVSSVMRMDELDRASATGAALQAGDARRQIDEAGFKGLLTIPDQGVTQPYLDILIDRKREELKRAEIIGSAPQGVGAGAARFGAAFVASMFDPVNVASGFVPVIGQARYLRWLKQAGGALGRAGVRAGVGAVEGATGAALVEPIIATAKSQEQADYDMNDSLANIAFGTVFGGGLHVVGGAGGDLYRKIRSATNPWDLPELKAGREANAALYDSVYAQLRGAGQADDVASANASLLASTVRSMADVSGEDLAKLNERWGPEISRSIQEGGGKEMSQRGQIRFGERVNAALFERADRSTFLHETGHPYLEMFNDLAGKADAPKSLQDDLAKLREWLGAKEAGITPEQHEQFARGLEAFVMEGGAPNAKLAKVFERFRDWLVKIYRGVRGLNVTLSDDVRGVYDRLIGGYDAAKKVELAGPTKREAALKAAIAQGVRGKKVTAAEPIINGDEGAARRAAENEADALDDGVTPEPIEEVADDTSLEAAQQSMDDLAAIIKASGDDEVTGQLNDLDEITEQASVYARVARAIAPCIGRTDG